MRSTFGRSACDGLVMIEAMACGTAVMAFNRGSVPEVVDDRLTGFVVEDAQGAIGAFDRLSQLSREKIRGHFKQPFTARRMALEYLATYRSLMDRRSSGNSGPGRSSGVETRLGAIRASAAFVRT
jgi:glycosyltransferase involved in cell wall biosynthesis